MPNDHRNEGRMTLADSRVSLREKTCFRGTKADSAVAVLRRRTIRSKRDSGWTALALGLTITFFGGNPARSADYGRELACIRTIDEFRGHNT